MDLTLVRRTDTRTAVLVILALSVGATCGYLLIARGPVQALAIAVLPALLIGMLRSVWVAFSSVVGAVCFLPYAVLPVGATVTPTLLEAALLASIGLTAAVVMIDRRVRLPTGLPQSLVALLIGVMTFAFLLGLGRGYSTQTAHDFFKFVLGIVTFWLVIQLIGSVADARRVLALIIGGVALSATIGLVLYAGGTSITERVLVRLVPYGYPGSRMARFIEDDPNQAMRAVGTSVDPNSYGGLLMIGFVLATGQVIVRKRSIPPGLALGASLVIGPALTLTYSRGAWLGVVAGVLVIVASRRPRLLLPGALVATGAIVLGIGGGFVNRLWLGLTLQDPATRLRLAEYENAWQIIQRHPRFGIGFGDAGSVELQAGVSSIYLTIAERAGLVGLGVFLVVVLVILGLGTQASLREGEDGSNDMALCWTAAFVAALTVGLVDHYFFNPPFAHMATLLWLVAGVVVRLSRSFDGPEVTLTAQLDGVSSALVPHQSRPRRTDAGWAAPLNTRTVEGD